MRKKKFAFTESFPAADESRNLSVPIEKKKGGILDEVLALLRYFNKEQTKRN